MKDENDELLAFIDAGLAGTRELVVAAGFLVDFLPFLRHMPSFFPGCGFQNQFAKWRDDNKLLRDMPFKRFKDAAVSLFSYVTCVHTADYKSCRTTRRSLSAFSRRSLRPLMTIARTPLTMTWRKLRTTS